MGKKKRKEGCYTGGHAVNPFTYSSLHAGVHHIESLVWFQAPVLLYHRNRALAETLPGHSPLLLCVPEIL